MVSEVCNNIEIDVATPSRYEAMMEEVGFGDVSEIDFKWPFKTWPKSRRDKMMGAWFRESSSVGIEDTAARLFTKF